MNEFDRDPGIVPAAPPRDLPPEPAKPGPFHLNSRKGELVQLASPLGAGALGLSENQPWIDHGKEIDKKRFLAQLEKGRSPGVAAYNIKIARCTAYGWKKADPDFDAAWKDAVETGLDLLETSVYDRGLKDGGEDARFMLKYRRYGNVDAPAAKSNFILNITLAEHNKRLERLGLPVPVIEGDYEEEDETNVSPQITSRS